MRKGKGTAHATHRQAGGRPKFLDVVAGLRTLTRVLREHGRLASRRNVLAVHDGRLE